MTVEAESARGEGEPLGPAKNSSLTQQQTAAIHLLATGRTITEAAAILGLARNTLSRWINQNSVVRATLDERSRELRQISAALDGAPKAG